MADPGRDHVKEAMSELESAVEMLEIVAVRVAAVQAEKVNAERRVRELTAKLVSVAQAQAVKPTTMSPETRAAILREMQQGGVLTADGVARMGDVRY